jgi:hypothetical protein
MHTVRGGWWCAGRRLCALPVAARFAELLAGAWAQVADAELGCGAPDGGCVCWCHAGVGPPGT